MVTINNVFACAGVATVCDVRVHEPQVVLRPHPLPRESDLMIKINHVCTCAGVAPISHVGMHQPWVDRAKSAEVVLEELDTDRGVPGNRGIRACYGSGQKG